MSDTANQMDTRLQDQVAKERIKDILFLIYGTHIADFQAEEILTSYNGYLNKVYITLQSYACVYYEDKLKK